MARLERRQLMAEGVSTAGRDPQMVNTRLWFKEDVFTSQQGTFGKFRFEGVSGINEIFIEPP